MEVHNVKIAFNGDVRRFPLSGEDPFEELVALFRRFYPEIEEFCFKYEDNDGDSVVFSSSEELNWAFRLAEEGSNYLKMQAFTDKSIASEKPPPNYDESEFVIVDNDTSPPEFEDVFDNEKSPKPHITVTDEEESKSDVPASVLESIEGVYECTMYTKSRFRQENDWHYVTIKRNDNEEEEEGYLWTNRAGVAWNLGKLESSSKPKRKWFSKNCDEIYVSDVSDNCPYFKDGYISCVVKVSHNRNGFRVGGLHGPWGEYYQRVSDLPLETDQTSEKDLTTSPQHVSIEGRYECTMYTKSNGEYKPNNWHYVRIKKDKSSGGYKWSNKAGVKWELGALEYPSDSKNPEKAFLAKVGSSCPYFKDGHKYCGVKYESGRVVGLFGPWDELYEKCD